MEDADSNLALSILRAAMDAVKAEAAVAADGPQFGAFRDYTPNEVALSEAQQRFARLLDRYVDARARAVAPRGYDLRNW